MYKWPKLFLSLSLFTLLTPNPSKALDNIYTATLTPEGNKIVSIFNSNGAHLGNIPISESYKSSQFVSGKWISNQLSIMAITKTDEKPKKATSTAYILNSSGNVVKTLNLGKGVLKAIGLDYNDNGIQDLAVQTASGVKIYLDPAVSNTTQGFSLSKKSDIIATQTTEKTGLANLTLQETNRNFLDDTKKPEKLSKNKNYITYKLPNKKKTIKVKLDTTIQSVLPLKIAGRKEPTFIAQRNASQLRVFGKDFKKYDFKKNKNAKLFTGLFSREDQSDIAIGQKLDENTGLATVKFINPTTRSERTITLDLSSIRASVSTLASSSACNEYWYLLEEYEKASSRGDSERMYEIIYDIYYINYERYIGCESTPPSDSTDENSDDFSYITSSVVFGSNTGMARTPCNELYTFNTKKNTMDGHRGFVAKNAENQFGIAYLTDEGGYKNGRILKTDTYKKVKKIRYDKEYRDESGARSLFRYDGKRLPMKAHIFAATKKDSGAVSCWKIPAGKIRID